MNVSEGDILYFYEYHFKDGKSQPKPKYFLVLKSLIDRDIVINLPTSQDWPLSDTEKDNKGCVEDEEKGINCFIIHSDEIVTKNGRSFPCKTHIYGHHVVKENQDWYANIYKEEDYETFGRIKTNLLKAIIKCILNSKHTKRGVKRMLS